MDIAIERKEFADLKRFCLSYVNGRGEFKSLNIVFNGDTATVCTTPMYRCAELPPPLIIALDEITILQARLYNMHIEFWQDFYGNHADDIYTWWELLMQFDNGKRIIKRGSDSLSPQWNRLIKIIGVYYEWMYKDWSKDKMYSTLYNHKTRQRELPKDTAAPYSDYWQNIEVPPAIKFTSAYELKPHTYICIYIRTNLIGTSSPAKNKLIDCHKFCKERDINIVREYIDEGVTGMNGKGKELQRLCDDIAKHDFTHVLVHATSGYSRDIPKSTYIIAELEKRGIRTVTLPLKGWGHWLYC
jgi:hypothetical protein